MGGRGLGGILLDWTLYLGNLVRSPHRYCQDGMKLSWTVGHPVKRLEIHLLMSAGKPSQNTLEVGSQNTINNLFLHPLLHWAYKIDTSANFSYHSYIISYFQCSCPALQARYYFSYCFSLEATCPAFSLLYQTKHKNLENILMPNLSNSTSFILSQTHFNWILIPFPSTKSVIVCPTCHCQCLNDRL